MFKLTQFNFLFKSFRLLVNHRQGKLYLIFFLTLFMGVNTGFSLVILIPLLQLLNRDITAPQDGQTLFLQQVAAKFGITLHMESVLLIFVVLLSFTALLQYGKALLDASYQQSFIYEIRSRLFRKIILSEWPLLNKKSKTNHLQVITKEIPNLAIYLFYYLRLLTSMLLTIVYISYAMVVSVKFTIIILIAALLLFILLRKFLFKAFHLGSGAVNSYTHLLKYIDDFWQTVKIAKVHSSEAFYYKKFNEANTSLLNIALRIQKNQSLPRLLYSIAGIIILVLVVYTGYRIDHVPLAALFTLILLFARIFPYFVSINTDISMILSNVASVQLVMQLDAAFADATFHQPINLHAIELEKEIKLEQLQFAFPGGKQLFNHLTDTIPAKKITGIVGVSGQGKTTLMDLIAGLQKPDSGKILIDGKPIENDQLPYWKRSIGYLPQDSFFIDGTLRENLIWDSAESITDEEILNVLEKVNALQLVKRFKKELDEYIVNYKFSFSGGECQRLALARVLLRKPQLLLLDEATSSLDPENEKQIMELISTLKNTVTIIFVTHRSSILSFFDKVIKI